MGFELRVNLSSFQEHAAAGAEHAGGGVGVGGGGEGRKSDRGVVSASDWHHGLGVGG